jgi:hypothetical protein
MEGEADANAQILNQDAHITTALETHRARSYSRSINRPRRQSATCCEGEAPKWWRLCAEELDLPVPRVGLSQEWACPKSSID